MILYVQEVFHHTATQCLGHTVRPRGACRVHSRVSDPDSDPNLGVMVGSGSFFQMRSDQDPVFKTWSDPDPV